MFYFLDSRSTIVDGDHEMRYSRHFGLSNAVLHHRQYPGCLLKKEESSINYMELLQRIRDNAQQSAEAKRRRMAASQSSAESDEWKRRYMRCQGKFERDCEAAREMICSAKDPEVVRLLYQRKVKRMSWTEAFCGRAVRAQRLMCDLQSAIICARIIRIGRRTVIAFDAA